MATAVASAHTAINSALTVGTELICAKCRALIVGYDRLYHDSPFVPRSIETTWTSDLINPDTQAKSRTWILAGKLDVLAAYHDKTVLVDAKTTSQDIADPDAPYWRQLAIEGQVDQYMLLLWMNGIKADMALWDVMKKPGISPKKITKAEVRGAVGMRTYFGRQLSDASIAEVATTERETLEMYEARLVRDCTDERPQHYFQRRTIPRLDAELLAYSREQWELGQEMLHTRNTGHWFRNSGACMLYGTPCKFLGICSGYDRPDSDKWTKKKQVHRELPTLEGDGRNVLSNTRIRCYQTCRRKHYYEYELGIERFDEEEKEALAFGSAWHRALEAWWHVLLKEKNNAEDIPTKQVQSQSDNRLLGVEEPAF